MGLSKVILLFLNLIFILNYQASAATSGITYTGKLLDSQNAPVVSDTVIFTVTVFDPTEKCWLYTEQRKVNLPRRKRRGITGSGRTHDFLRVTSFGKSSPCAGSSPFSA